MLKYGDGRDVINVINTVVRYAYTVPEAFSHPISQLITDLRPPVVRSVNDTETRRPISIFATSAGADVIMKPNVWEVWCSNLKAHTLVKYINYKLSGMKLTAIVAKMVDEMKPSELVEEHHLGGNRGQYWKHDILLPAWTHPRLHELSRDRGRQLQRRQQLLEDPLQRRALSRN
jgi:hypothetical protein